jgi:hypothetical protein
MGAARQHRARRCHGRCRTSRPATAVASAKRIGDGECLGRRAVEPLARLSRRVEAVLFTADDSDLDLEHDAETCGLSKEFARLREVVGQWQRRPVVHVGVEERRLVVRDACSRCRKQRPEEVIDECRRAVIGVQRGQARIARRDDLCESGQRARSGDRVAGGGEGGS